MTILHMDYETRSRCDLRKQGVYNYARHESTSILMLGWAFDDEEPQLWLPGQPFPQRIADHFAAGEPRSIHCHNAGFERLITQYVLRWVGIKQPPIEAFYCTAAQARARALPGALDELGRCLGAKFQKDRRGQELIKLLCIPQEDSTFNNDPELMREMGEYCLQDVRVERIAASMSAPLTDEEFADYVANERVNDMGLLVDVEFAAAARNYADDEMKQISELLAKASNNQITSPRQYKRLKELLEVYFEKDDRVRKAMTVVKTDRRTGEEVRKIAFDKDARSKLLLLAQDEPELFPEHILDIIDLCDEAGRSSVAKYDNMVYRADDNGIVRGAYIFAGAGQTGRFSSTGLQVHNMPRKTAKNPLEVRELVLGDWELDDVMDTLSSMLRPSIIAGEGNELVWSDWSAIEARMLPWLSGDLGGEQVLKVFRTNDADPSLPDIYKVEYSNAYGVPATEVDKDQRAVGKVMVLSCIAEGELVLVHPGILKPIEKVLDSDRVWDGVEWVRHDGVVCRGEKDVIEYEGLWATEDHIVWSEIGPLPFGTCARQQITLATTGIGRSAIRYCRYRGSDGSLGGGSARPQRARCSAEENKSSMHRVQNHEVGRPEQSIVGQNARLSVLQPEVRRTRVANQTHAAGEIALHEPEGSRLPQIRGAGDKVSLSVSRSCGGVGHEQPWASAREGTGSRRQQQELRAGQPTLGQQAGEQSKPAEVARHDRRRDVGAREQSVSLYDNNTLHARRGTEGSSNRDSVQSGPRPPEELAPHKKSSRRTRVYDLVNAGPRHRFTVSGRLVHNCGYQGGKRAFQAMARNYQVSFTDEEAMRLVLAWREANPWAPRFWKEVERAAKDAVRYPGEMFTAGRLSYCMPDEKAPLYCLLPSGRVLSYPQPRLEYVEGRFGPESTLSCIKAQWAPKQGETEWGRVNLYGGLLVENATQGESATLLRRGIRMVLDDGWPLAGHTHDELMLRVRADEVAEAEEELKAVMLDVPAWAAGLPLACEVSHGERYRK